MSPLVALIMAAAGFTLNEARHRRIEKERFARSMERFPGLLDQVAGWSHDARAERTEYVIDLRDPPEVK